MRVVPVSLDRTTFRLCLRKAPVLGYKPNWQHLSLNDGYLCVSCPEHPNAMRRGWVYVQRIVAECSVGRLLASDEVAHHVNRNKLDNRQANLEVRSRSNHGVLHAKPTTYVRLTCAYCGKSFLRRKGQEPAAKKNKVPFCSRSCMGSYGVRHGFGRLPLPPEEKRRRLAQRAREFRARRKLDTI